MDTGTEIVQGLPDYGLVVKGGAEAVEAVGGLEYVAWIAPYHPGLKLAANLFGTPARKLAPSGIQVERLAAAGLPYGEYELSFFKGEEPASAIAEVEAAGGEALFVEANVASGEDMQRFVDETVTRFGALHCAVNNAAAGAGFRLLEEIPEPGPETYA